MNMHTAILVECSYQYENLLEIKRIVLLVFLIKLHIIAITILSERIGR